MSMVEWINRKTGRRFWYAIELKFYTKNPEGLACNSKVITCYADVGFYEKAHILSRRKLKKHFGWWAEKVSKQIRGGIFEIEILSYLGWFKKQ